MPDMFERNAHISTEEIERDIQQTEREIVLLEHEAKHFEATPHASRDYKMNQFLAHGRRSGIKERNEFVAKLRSILDHRRQAKETE